MFSFWYRYIPANMFMIASEDFETLYDTCIKPTLSSFMGYIFEEMCKRYMQQQNRCGNAPFKIQKLGRWWGNSLVRRREMGLNIMNKLADQSQIFCQFSEKYYILFSKSGFKTELKEAEQRGGCRLISLEYMY